MKYGLAVLVMLAVCAFLSAPVLAAEQPASPESPAASPDCKKTAAPAVPAKGKAPAAEKAAPAKGKAPAAAPAAAMPETLADKGGRIKWKRKNTSGRKAAPAKERGLFSVIMSMLIWAGVVIVIIVAGLWIVKKLFPGTKRLFGSKLMRILGRTHLSPKHSVYILKVGDRVLVLGVAGDEIRPLSEITDSQEVAFLTAEGTPPLQDAKKKSFAGLFRRTRERFTPPPEPADSGISETKEEIDRIRRMVSSWKERYKDAEGANG